MALTSPISSVECPSQSSDSKLLKRMFRSLSLIHGREEHKPVGVPHVQQRQKEARVSAAFSKHFIRLRLKQDQRARESALLVRSLIVGPSETTSRLTIANAKPRLEKIKSQLTKPGTANKVIAHLRALPISDAVIEGKEENKDSCISMGTPIRAVCLEHPDAEQHRLHFASLAQKPKIQIQKSSVPSLNIAAISSAPLEKLSAMFHEMNIVDLMQPPDFGLGRPGSEKGLLAGALPTAETVIDGVKMITPQLMIMSLGYATGQAIYPDHKGIHPPTDRISVLTYWWGLEVVLPPPTLAYFSEAQSIANTAINFLSAIALVQNGVREILPFIRYMAQFIDFEFDAIKQQDRGRGVVCAATWIMPAALVPRPWDFPEPEQPQGGSAQTSPALPNSHCVPVETPQIFADSISVQTASASVASTN